MSAQWKKNPNNMDTQFQINKTAVFIFYEMTRSIESLFSWSIVFKTVENYSWWMYCTVTRTVPCTVLYKKLGTILLHALRNKENKFIISNHWIKNVIIESTN